MTNTKSIAAARPELAANNNGVCATADVLVVGGGPAGCWAAISAAESGASVVLVDKGYCGTSGATASGGTGVWYVEPDADAREEAIQSREGLGGWLVDRRWMHRVLDKTYEQMNRLAEWGYPFPVTADGKQVRRGVQGPEYMRRMRKQVVRSRVRILDQSPALELLQGSDGGVTGARGVRRQQGDAWTVHAGAVVVATGGCAFLSGGLGCDVLTGDGSLMAAEAGAEFSGMEFSNSYAISPTFSTVTKTAFYRFATFYTDEGLLEGAGAQRGRSVIAKSLLIGPVYAQLDQAPSQIEGALRDAQPNFFLPFDREGINPFTQRFPVTLRLEGTVRGTGGLRLTDNYCATTVPGLFAAGDAATRELICGGFTGGGSHNSAWALSSGSWAGEGAAAYAKAERGASTGEPIGVAGLNPTAGVDRELTAALVTTAVQDEVHPYDKNYFRTRDALKQSLTNLEDLWNRVETGLRGGDGYPPSGEASATALFRAREAAAMVAHARWMYNAANERTETRGMHKRADHPQLDPSQQQRRVVGGLTAVWNGLDPERPYSSLEVAT
ncbi:MAG TPA: FAD-binding protein [Solirubrobacteraceae bacterium]|jgi:succinate dehydrogenase/fumarate reductase flavoprotein subunit|nr:FAD-binding protein [Solirubrobacteraceae bacterium]